MRIVLASDTHDRHRGLPVPEGDVFIHAGDFTMKGNLKAVGAFGAWIRALPHRYKVVIAGMDDLLERVNLRRRIRSRESV